MSHISIQKDDVIVASYDGKANSCSDQHLAVAQNFPFNKLAGVLPVRAFWDEDCSTVFDGYDDNGNSIWVEDCDDVKRYKQYQFRYAPQDLALLSQRVSDAQKVYEKRFEFRDYDPLSSSARWTWFFSGVTLSSAAVLFFRKYDDEFLGKHVNLDRVYPVMDFFRRRWLLVSGVGMLGGVLSLGIGHLLNKAKYHTQKGFNTLQASLYTDPQAALNKRDELITTQRALIEDIQALSNRADGYTCERVEDVFAHRHSVLAEKHDQFRQTALDLGDVNTDLLQAVYRDAPIENYFNQLPDNQASH